MHMSLPIGSSVLMGSDTSSAFGPPTVMGNNFSISYLTETKEETDDLFAKVSEGGAVTMPPADMFWGAYFGSCTGQVRHQLAVQLRAAGRIARGRGLAD